MNDVIYLSYDGMTDPLGMSQVLPYLTELSKRGFRIHLISFEKPEAFEKKGRELAETISAAGIQWYPEVYHKSPPVASTLYDIWKMKRAASKICSLHNIRIIHCRSYIAGIVGLSIKNSFHIPMIFDMRGFWADERVEGRIWNLKNPVFRMIYNYFKKKEEELLLKADEVISLTTKGKEILQDQFGSLVSEKISVIPCCTDLLHFSEKSIEQTMKKQFQMELGITEDDKVLSYVGSLGTWYMSDEMVDFFKVARDNGSFTKFLVITKDDPTRLLEHAASKGLPDHSILVKPADRKELPSLLDLAAWSLFFIRPSFSKSASSPTKMGELLAMGKGIIANKGIGDNDLLFEKYHCGVLVDSLDQDGYEAALKSVQDFDKSKARDAAEDYFSLQEGVSRYERVYKRLL